MTCSRCAEHPASSDVPFCPACLGKLWSRTRDDARQREFDRIFYVTEKCEATDAIVRPKYEIPCNTDQGEM